MVKQVATFFLLYFITSCVKEEVLLTNLKEHQANEVLVALYRQDIKAKKTKDSAKKEPKYSVSVKEKDFIESLKIIQNEKLPKKDSLTLKEIFFEQKAGFLPSKTEEKAKLILAQEGEMESLLKSLPGIVEAKVVFSMAKDENFFLNINEKAKKGASVLIIKNSSENIIDLNDIKSLISSAILDINKDDITVVIKELINPIEIKEIEKIIYINNKKYILISFLLVFISLMVSIYFMGRLRWIVKNQKTS